jgi:hypothetical protein
MGQKKLKEERRLVRLNDHRTELEKERDRQIANKKDWDAYMDSTGLSSMENFHFLPSLRVLVSDEMIEVDKKKPKNAQWKVGDRYPLTGEYVEPKAITEEEAQQRLQKLLELESSTTNEHKVAIEDKPVLA